LVTKSGQNSHRYIIYDQENLTFCDQKWKTVSISPELPLA